MESGAGHIIRIVATTAFIWWAGGLAFLGVSAVILYGLVVLILRNSSGIELPQAR